VQWWWVHRFEGGEGEGEGEEEGGVSFFFSWVFCVKV
jgi:hypothetical protein